MVGTFNKISGQWNHIRLREDRRILLTPLTQYELHTKSRERRWRGSLTGGLLVRVQPDEPFTLQ